MCNQHPKPKASLVKEFAIHTTISIENAQNIIDRLRHLAYCIDEPEAITLLRLQAGKNQVIKARDKNGAQVPD